MKLTEQEEAKVRELSKRGWPNHGLTSLEQAWLLDMRKKLDAPNSKATVAAP